MAQNPQGVITAPPGLEEKWMVKPQAVPSCPPGLEYLTTIDQLIVKQKKSLLKIAIDWQTRNKFKVKNSLGQTVYDAKEDSDCLTRYCFGTIRPYDLEIRDNLGQEVIHVYRRLACQGCCCPCYLQLLRVEAPPGTIIGTVEQEWSIIKPKFRLCDAAGNVILRLRGPFCTMSCCGNDVKFKVLSADGETEVGQISKQWAGLATEMFTDADNFGVSFPLDLDVRMKAVMIGAVFLINSMYYEHN